MNYSNTSFNDPLFRIKQLAAQGDEAAFRQIFNHLFNNLVQFVNALVKSKEVATDVVDELFVWLWHNRSQLNSIGNLKVYLYRAAKNAALNYLSQKARQRIHEPFDDIHIDLSDSVCPEKLLINKETLSLIRQAVDGLPPRCKMVFKLVREDGLKYQEVADILNLSIKTIDAQMVIAVSRLREAMNGHLQMPAKKKNQ